MRARVARALTPHATAQGCGPGCTAEGIHYSNQTYEVLAQQLLAAAGADARAPPCAPA